MPTKVFITGATGYIGGDALANIYSKQPQWQYRALVRDLNKAAPLKEIAPNVEFVKGALDDSSLLVEEAKNADVVLHLADADHAGAANAIAEGLAAHSPQSPGWFIHCSGTGVLTWPDLDNGTFGQHSDKIWHDVSDIREIQNIPDRALHRSVDKIVLEAGTKSSGHVKTAVVCPPLIYGKGRSPVRHESLQLPILSRSMIGQKQPFKVGEGKNLWSNVHVHDLSDLWYLLAEDAASGGPKGTWNDEGYYFVESGDGDRVWGELAEALGNTLHQRGLVPTSDTKSLPAAEVKNIHPYGPVLWGSNSRSRAERARKYLGWAPKMTGVEASLPSVVDGVA